MSRADVKAGLLLGLVAIALVLPEALAGGTLSNDGIEHLAIANAWVHGQGFVDPVAFYYVLEQPPPLPATAVRPPVVPLLLAGGIAAGATVETLIVLHALLSGAVAVGFFLLASRLMRRPAAVAATLLLVTSPVWRTMAVTPLTEISGVAVYLAVLALAAPASRSPGVAVLAALATFAAGLTRPNLLPLFLAVAVAMGWERGVRSRSLWVYLGAFGLVYLATDRVLVATTGRGLYDGYAVLQRMLTFGDAWRVDATTLGTLDFVRDNAGAIADRMQGHARRLFAALFLSPQHHFAGWLVPLALWIGLRPGRETSLVHRVDAFAVLGFSLLMVTNFAAFDQRRYPLFAAVPAMLSGVAWLDVAVGERLHRYRWLPAALLGALAAVYLGMSAPGLPDAVRSYLDARRRTHPVAEETDLRTLCGEIDPDAVVATSDPWTLHRWCGNAALRIPVKPGTPEQLAAFLDVHTPTYLLLGGRKFEYTKLWLEELPAQPRFRVLATTDRYTLFEDLRVRQRRVWRAPPPLVCVGRGPGCESARGRSH